MEILNEKGVIDLDVQDILYELGNVGLGMASITLGKIMGVRMHIGVPKIEEVDDKLVQRLCGVKDSISFQMKFEKTLRGSMLFILREKFLEDVLDRMFLEDSKDMDDAEKVSALKEFANMICASYLKAIGQYTGIRMYVKPSNVNVHRDEKMVKDEYESLMEVCNQAICVDTGFDIVTSGGITVEDVGHVVMLPDGESVKKLIEPLMD